MNNDSQYPISVIHLSEVADGDFKHKSICLEWSKCLLEYLLRIVGQSPEISIGCYQHGAATFLAFDIQSSQHEGGVSYTVGLTKNYIELPSDVSHSSEFFVPGVIDAFEIISNIANNTSATIKINRF